MSTITQRRLDAVRSDYCKLKSELKATVNHAAQLAEALRDTGHDLSEIALWLKCPDSKPEAKLKSIATLLAHNQNKRREALAAMGRSEMMSGLFEETSTEKSVNWSKAFCTVCQPIVDRHFRKREREMQAEIARLQRELDKALGREARNEEPSPDVRDD